MKIYDDKWWDKSCNPIRGCNKISPGCVNCYACDILQNIEKVNPYKVTLNEENLYLPRTWRTSQKVFMGNMCDVFNSQVPDKYIDKIFNSMHSTPHHTFFIITKRAERMRDYCNNFYEKHRYFPKKLWIGVTAEDQQRADERIPVLLDTIAYHHFVSVEPLLEPVTLMFNNGKRSLKWVVCGGEKIITPRNNSHKARFMDPDWARSIRDQSSANGVPFFMKQMTDKAPIPPDLNIKQFPSQLP